MVGKPERRVEGSDYDIIRRALEASLQRAKAKSTKVWLHTVDMDCVMTMVYSRDTAYIVGGYLVVYDVLVPEYTTARFLEEVLVCRLSRGTSFDVVTSFLCRKAEEAGCVIVGVGTALAWNDDALASLYIKDGFSIEATSLVKVL